MAVVSSRGIFYPALVAARMVLGIVKREKNETSDPNHLAAEIVANMLNFARKGDAGKTACRLDTLIGEPPKPEGLGWLTSVLLQWQEGNP